ncbi:MAG: AarF/UbiB family protein [Chloroflexota bacterium]|jgi:ubiquinone biosynthesis protein|nr:AarF/UbiB family protein [Chloroflexota bacterium]MDH5243163.1 AarF/UbiB family protein [Chloroflexota bacterium]
MRRFLVEVVIDALLVFVLLNLLSLIHVPQPFPFGSERVPIFRSAGAGPLALLLAGIAIGLADRFVRPIIVAFTGRWVLSTMGLALLLVNVVSLWIATLIVPDLAVSAQPRLLWFFIAAALFTVSSTVVDALLGLNVPDVGDQGEGRSIWRILDALPTPRRSRIIENVRLQQVYDTIYRYGLDIALERTPIAALRASFQRRVLGRKVRDEDLTPEARVRVMLQQLGPTYVKLGQMAASRREALPPALVSELERLQSNVGAFPWEAAERILVAELGHPVDELYASIDHEPFAAASTAQVHRATLPTGEEVAVKIQRPNIVAKTKADLGVLEELGRVAERRSALATKIGAQAMIREFAAGVLKELDYRNEAYHALRIADSMRRFPEIHVPVVDNDRSTARVLTAEFVRGIKISDVEGLRNAGLDTTHLGSVFIRALIKQVLVDGFFHGDPHPGNILVDPDTGQIIFLDFGLVGELRPDQRLTLIQLLFALRNADSSGIADALLGLGKPGTAFDERRFRGDVDRMTRQYLIYGKVDSVGAGISAVLSAVFDNGLRLDNDLTLAIKAVVQAEETAMILGFDVDIASAAFEEARAAALERFTPEAVEKIVMDQAVRAGQEFARRLPTLESAVWKWMDQFGKGKLVVEIDTSELNREIGRVSDLGRQVAVGMLVTGQLIGTAILAVVLLQPSTIAEFATFAYFGLIAFGVSLIVSMVVLFRTLRSPASDARSDDG